MMASPNTMKLTSTPAVYISAWLRRRAGFSPLSNRLTALIESTGNTHGIRFSTRPPPSASNNAYQRLTLSELPFTSAGGISGAGPLAGVPVAVAPLVKSMLASRVISG